MHDTKEKKRKEKKRKGKKKKVITLDFHSYTT